MKTLEQIVHTPPSLRMQHITELLECFITIYDSGILYQSSFYADEYIDDTDKAMGRENVFVSKKTYVLKQNLVGIEKWWLKIDECWCIYLFCNGMHQDLSWYFKKEEEADELFIKLFNYLHEKY